MTTQTQALASFLFARIDDDEERARFVESQQSDWDRRHAFEEWRLSWQDEYNLLCIDPSRALAECAAKRRSIAAVMPLMEEWGDGENLARDWMKALAFPYAAHPDWREVWRP